MGKSATYVQVNYVTSHAVTFPQSANPSPLTQVKTINDHETRSLSLTKWQVFILRHSKKLTKPDHWRTTMKGNWSGPWDYRPVECTPRKGSNSSIKSHIQC
ncbi:hypothetical protein E2C01_052046 [Portunus trituberculatus]|uniref:Uncharacterized protein n=1 Tax=Portunus trituberculatus TaxID=210409 RepID=A0A5B7GKM0_PORTR|nr:hypothetical protein [Portunus trituberculatus]